MKRLKRAKPKQTQGQESRLIAETFVKPCVVCGAASVVTRGWSRPGTDQTILYCLCEHCCRTRSQKDVEEALCRELSRPRILPSVHVEDDGSITLGATLITATRLN